MDHERTRYRWNVGPNALVLLAWAMYAVSYALPSFSVQQSLFYGYYCAWFSAQMTVGIGYDLFTGQFEGPILEAFIYGLGTQANTAMLLSPLLLQPRWRRIRIAAHVWLAIAAVGVWVLPFGDYKSFRIGYYVWSVSFTLLLAGFTWHWLGKYPPIRLKFSLRSLILLVVVATFGIGAIYSRDAGVGLQASCAILSAGALAWSLWKDHALLAAGPNAPAEPDAPVEQDA